MELEHLDLENTKGLPYNKELADELAQDASANLKSFLDEFDFDKELEKKNNPPSLENNFTDVGDDLGEYSPAGIELHGYHVYVSLTDEDLFAIRKMGKKTRFITVYQSMVIHTIDKFIVFPGTDDVKYFNTITHRMATKHLR